MIYAFLTIRDWLRQNGKVRKWWACFALNPHILERDDVAPVRVTYMIGCLQKLQQRYAEVGSQLLILHANPVQAIPALAEAINAKAVFWNWDVEPYSQERDRAIINVLKEKGIEFLNQIWDQLLNSPEEIRTGNNSPYTFIPPSGKIGLLNQKVNQYKHCKMLRA